LKNITQKEIFVSALGLFGSSKLTAKAVVIALAAGLLGAGAAVISPAEPANATSCSSAATGYADGSGDGTSTATALRIATAAHLIRLSATSADWTGKFFIQTADIDLGGCEWTPIGLTSSSKFTGSYNGGGFTIQGLKITTRRNYVGMFGYIDGARIERLVLKGEINVSHTPPNTDDVYYVGALVGTARGLPSVISQVRSEVSMVTNVRSTGGIVAEMTGTLQYSSFEASMQVERGPGNTWGYSGGLTATMNGGTSINNSYSRASFSGASIYKTGINSIGNLPITRSYSASTGVNAALAGEGSSGAVNAFWDATLAPGINPRWVDSSAITNAIGVSTSSMTSIRTFSTGASAWDIVEGWEPFSTTSTPAKIWGICSRVNDGYPFLLWEYSTDPCTVTPPPSNSGSGSSSGSVYVAPVVVPEAVISLTIRQTTTRPATDDKPARLLGRSLDKDVLFIADSARLSSEAKKSLRQAARLAMASDGKVAVTGFAAMTNRGSAYEKSVAQKRALAVARYLRAQGFDDWIYYQGLSGRQGLAFDGDPRRVEIRILN
jgi:outer membrane protein OmpA-like peptidoglycan-associated protein